MKSKILVLLTGIAIISAAQMADAKPKQEKSILATQTKQIIYNRLCNAFRSKEYTYEEISSAAKSMIIANINFPENTLKSTGTGGFDVYTDAVIELKDLARERVIAHEHYNLMTSVIKDKNCWM
jgi:hypothetical protein